MFFSKKKESKWQKKAQHLFEMTQKVLNFRRDILPTEGVSAILDASSQLTNALNASPLNEKNIETAYNYLDELLKKYGGRVYPVTFFSDNIEVLIVTLILAIGIRTFFVQPFKIPTNSMWPSYYGMTSEVYRSHEEEPTKLQKIWRKIRLGADNYEVLAPTSGPLMIPVFQGQEKESRMGAIKFKLAKGRHWFGLLPTTVREYTFYVNGKPATIQVPLDFNLDTVIQERFFNKKALLSDHLDENSGKVFTPKIVMTKSGPMLLLKENIQQGQAILDFDILTGDMLFVDRFTYNFRTPKVGEAIVFYTRKIEYLKDANGNPDDRYYIKRLVGLPGDILKIEEPVLYRNEKPIEGISAFDKNAKREDGYPGYVNDGYLNVGLTVQVPENMFLGLGDNSPGSLDGRRFGFVPEKEVIGRAVFTFYPFTKRWGIEK